MAEVLVSKRELLEMYGISYGALYRWKRIGLIPESWFIRKSTPVGQETFFERDRICPRIEMILSRKDGVSLDELADELIGEKQKKSSQRCLVIETEYDKHTYPLEQLVSCSVTEGNSKKSLIEYLKEVEL